MVDKTQHFQFEFPEAGENFTAKMDEKRFSTLDVQLQAIFKALGNGRITDSETWNLLTQSQLNTRIDRDNIVPIYDNVSYFTDDPTGDKSDRYVYLTPGEGVVNNMGVKTERYLKIGYLPNTINYIYMSTTNTTPLTQKPGISISAVEKDVNQTQLLIGVITVDEEGSNFTLNIDQNRLLEVSTLSVALRDLIQHTHGREGISKIELATEVRGLLNAENISNIDPSRINEGTLSPALISLSHLLLKDSGDLTHEELDSAVELLQQDNKKLFGDLSTTNLLQTIIGVKKSYANIDRYFRNIIVIIPGIDNITNNNEDSWLDASSYVFSSTEATDATTKSTAVSDTNQNKRTDSSIVDFANAEIRGVLASGSSVGECTIDTKAEFDLGTFDSNYIDVNSQTSIVFGYGYGCGEGTTLGASFFDVFGVATGTFQNGIPFHYGYALIPFPAYTCGYGYGYQYTDGGDFSPGNVNVTLKPGSTDVELYNPTNDSLSGDFLTDDDFYQEIFNVAQETPTFAEGQWYMTGLIRTSGGKGGAINIDYFDSILRYEVDSTSSTFAGDISDTNALQIAFNRDPNNDGYWYRTADLDASPIIITDNDDYTFEYNWTLRVTFTDFSTVDIPVPGMEQGTTVDGNTIVQVPLALAKATGKTVKRFEMIPDVNAQELKEFFTNNNLTPFNDSNLSNTATTPDNGLIFFNNKDTDNQKGISNFYYEDTDEGAFRIGSYPLVWTRAIGSIGLTGNVKFSSEDTNNQIEDLFCIISSDPAVTWNTISWIADEPDDSKVVIELRTIDSNNETSAPHTALAAATFGSPYCNTSGTLSGESFIARPSGSSITENADSNGDSRGTHLELRVTLQPSSDGLVAPTLHSITVKYGVASDDSQTLIQGSEGWNPNLQTDSSRTNVRMSPDKSIESLEIKNFSDLDKLIVGKDSSLVKYTRQSDQSFKITTTKDSIDISTIPSPLQIINGKSSSSEAAGKLYAVKKLANHDLVVADTENHRILILDQNNNFNVKKAIYGSVGMTSIDRTTKADGIDKSFSILQSIYNKTEKSIYIVFSHMLDANDFDITSLQITSISNVLSTYTLSSTGNYSNTLSYDFSKTLSDESASHIRIPSAFFVKNQSGAQSGLVAGNVLRIKLSDADVNSINAIPKPRQINVLVYSDSLGEFLIPVHQDLNPITDGSSSDGLSITHRLFAALQEANIYYRPIVNPIDVEVLNDGTIAVCNVIGKTGLEENSSEFGDFEYHYRKTTEKKINDVTASATTHPRIQFYDLNESDLVAVDSSGNTRYSQGIIDGDDKPAQFSLVFYGGLKEVLVGGTYYYLIADPGNQKIFVCNTDFTNKLFEGKITNLSPKPGKSSKYYPSSADRNSSNYFVGLLGFGSGIPNDNKIIQLSQDLSYTILLDKQVSNPVDINVLGETKIVIST